MSEPTTEYGEYHHYAETSCHTMREEIGQAVGEWAYCYDLEGLEKAYREAINEVLPEGVSLHGDKFYGPHPKTGPLMDQVRTAVRSVDFWEVAEKFDLLLDVTEEDE